MADDTPFDDADPADEPLRPAWEDTPDETDADRLPGRRQPPVAGDSDWRAVADLPVLVTALADARACHQLSQTMLATSWTAARKFRAVFSYRVAIARNCLILAKKFSIKWRAA